MPTVYVPEDQPIEVTVGAPTFVTGVGGIDGITEARAVELDAQTLAAAKAYADEIDTVPFEYVDDGDADAVTQAKTYTDDAIAGIDFPDTGVPEAVIDEKDAATLEAAREYAREQLEANPGGVSEAVVDQKITAAVESIPAPDVDLATVDQKDEAVLSQARAYVDGKPIYEAIEVDGALTLEVQGGVMYELSGTGDTTLSGPLGTVAAIAQSGGVTINGAPVVRLSVVTRLADGWEVLAAGGGGSVEPPAPPTLTLAAATVSTVRVTWTAVAGATSYEARVNGGTASNIGNVLEWTAEGLPSAQTGTVSIRAVGVGGESAWVSLAFTTAAPPLSVVRLAPEDASITESGSGSAGWTYTFVNSPYGGWLRSGFLKIPAGQDGFIQFTVQAMTSALTVDLDGGTESSIIGVSIPALGSGNKYTPNARPHQPASSVEALAGDVVRIGRTGTTVWVRVSRDAGVTFDDIFSKVATDGGVPISPLLRVAAMGNKASGVLANIRGVGWV